MQTDEMIRATEFCIHHNIELSFIYSLEGSGLIEIVNVEEEIFVPLDQLNHLEKMVRLYHDMDINIEGIETINYLLDRINAMQHQIIGLRNRLHIYEND
jgi:hypothetical protein